MLIKARKSLFNDNNVAILNSKIAITIPILNPNKQVVIIQQNTTRHKINWIQIKRFAKTNNRNIILFPTKHLYTKKNGNQIVNDIDLLTVEDNKKTCIRPGILYYYKEMFACLLTNLNIRLGMVTRA